MSKQLKDYINFYIGCNVIVDRSHVDKETVSGVLSSVHTEYGSFRCTYMNDGEMELANTENVKPVLRKISSLTFEERKRLWEIVFNRPFQKSGNEKYFDSEVPRWVLMSGVERIGIQVDGRVWADSDLSRWDFNHHETTRYLCSIGIDCFGLIIEGMAVNAETIKQQ